MAKRTVGKLNVQMTADSARLKRGLQAARGDVRKFSGDATSTVKRMGQGIAVGVGAAVGLAAVNAFKRSIAAVKRVLSSELANLDEIGKFSDRLGITTENLAALQLQAGLAGVSTRELNVSMRTMLRNIGDASQGIGEAATTLRDLGLNAEGLSRLETGDQFRVIAGQIAKLPTAAARAAAAYRIFGRSGVQLISTLKDGVKGVDAARARSLQLGAAVSREQASRVELLNDSVLELKTAWVGMARQLISNTAPAFTAIVRAMTDASTTSSGLGRAVSSMGETFVKTVRTMLNGASLLRKSLGGLQQFTTKALQKMAEGLSKINPSSEESKMWRIFGEELSNTANELERANRNQLLGDRLASEMAIIAEESRKIASEWGITNRNATMAAESLGDASDAIEKIAATRAADKVAAMRSAADGLFNATRTPAEAFIQRLKTIRDLAREGALGIQLQHRATAQLAKEIAGSDSAKDIIALLKSRKDIFAFDIEKAMKQSAITDKMGKLKDSAAAILEKIKTPMERLREEYNKLRELFKAGLISRDQARRAFEMFREELMPKAEAVTAAAGVAASRVEMGALGVGGAAGRSQDKVERNTADEVKESKKQTRLQEEANAMARAAAGGNVVVQF